MNALLSPPACRECDDRGWIVGVGADGVTRARSCACRSRSRTSTAIDAAGIPQRYRHCNIANFNALNDSLARAKRAAEEFVATYPQNDAGLLFQGPCGSGKSHLAVAILSDLVKRFGIHARYVDCPLLIRQLQDAFREDDISRRELIRPIEESDLVLFDDLGGSKASDWVRDTFSALINVRYNEQRLTLVTTRFADGGDLDLEAQVGAAVRSRLYEMCVSYTLDASDFRRDVRNASH